MTDRSQTRWRLALVLLIAWLGWTAVLLSTTGAPTVVLTGRNSDLYSHVMSAGIFLQDGATVWTAPMGERCVYPEGPGPLADQMLHTARELAVAPVDVCVLRDPWTTREVVVNWPTFPRPYPPGNMVWFMPEAWMYFHGDADFQTINAVAVTGCLLTAHVAVGLLWLLLAPVRPRAIAWVVTGGFYAYALGWSLAGYYDTLATALILAACLAYQRGRATLALGAVLVAPFFHYRALWFAPLALVLAHRAWSDRRRGLVVARTDTLFAVGGALAAGVAAVVLLLLLPALGEFPVNHEHHWRRLSSLGGRSAASLIAVVAIGAWWAWKKPRVLGATVVWLVAMIVAAPQAMPWHGLMLIALPGLAVVDTEDGSSAQAATVAAAAILVEASLQLFFDTTMWPGWMEALGSRLSG